MKKRRTNVEQNYVKKCEKTQKGEKRGKSAKRRPGAGKNVEKRRVNKAKSTLGPKNDENRRKSTKIDVKSTKSLRKMKKMEKMATKFFIFSNPKNEENGEFGRPNSSFFQPRKMKKMEN